MAPAKTSERQGAAHAPMHDPKQGKRQDKSSKQTLRQSTRDDERAAEAEVKEQPQANDGYQVKSPKPNGVEVEPPRKKGESTEDEKGAPPTNGRY